MNLYERGLASQKQAVGGTGIPVAYGLGLTAFFVLMFMVLAPARNTR